HNNMTKFLKTLWKIVTYPFVLVFKIITFPFRAIRAAYRFLNEEPEENPMMDVVAGVMTDANVRQNLWDEFDVFRKHLMRAVIGLMIGVAISFKYTVPLMTYLSSPIGGLESLQAIEVTEEIGVFMRVALMSGIAIMLPYIAFEIWLFAAPGLKSRERKMGLAGIPLAGILFAAGMAFTFFVLLPAALPFLGGFTQIAEFWSAREYFKFVTGLMLWIGIFFEFPLVIYILTSIGFVKPAVLAQQWRLAVVIISIIAAAVTPTIDPVNMGLVMLPMTLLYFVSIGLSYIAYAGRKRIQARTAEEETESI
ncbi:MAG TPA: twin-arginine translocase subunit TatC, partial [Anaerolineales bacterium]|nr:twin-arginine translocase subunit TatC [Anaerolineales bacterium]